VCSLDSTSHGLGILRWDNIAPYLLIQHTKYFFPTDSIYTERYMGLPNTNEVGYDNSRLSTMAVKLRGKKYLLVHGTSDDNVHYQQAMILAKNLERQDILFKQIVSIFPISTFHIFLIKKYSLRATLMRITV